MLPVDSLIDVCDNGVLMRPHASALVTFGMAALALLVGVAVVVAQSAAATEKRGRYCLRGGLLLATWMVLTGFAAGHRLLAQFDRRPPPLLIAIVLALLAAVVLATSRVGKRLAQLSLPILVGFHGFRLLLELLMHQAAVEGVMPVQMSFSGWNFDIISGVTAPLVALLATRGRARWLVITWNVIAFLLMTNIAIIALASTPMIHAFGTGASQLNTWVAYFPFIWLPTVLLPAALLGQLVLTRRLLARS
jgi:hypothetical protein